MALVRRDEQIIKMIGEGYSFQLIADQFGLSKQRVSQINQEHQEAVPDDAYRDLQRTQLEHIIEELFTIFRGPGQKVVSPGGKVVCEYNDDGTIDFSRPLYDPYAKVKVADTLIRAHERLAKAYGLDRNRQRERDQSGEMDEFLAYIQQLDEENKLLRARLGDDTQIVTAEIVEG